MRQSAGRCIAADTCLETELRDQTALEMVEKPGRVRMVASLPGRDRVSPRDHQSVSRCEDVRVHKAVCPDNGIHGGVIPRCDLPEGIT